MTINSTRANEIQAYLDSKKESIKKGLQKIEINGKMEVLESYMIPITYLQYNHANRRFNLEISEFEANLGRQLNPADKTDAEKIKELLLQDSVEAEKLYNDLKLLGEQREFASITFDGVVVNGNRRMATLERLHKEEPTGKWSNLWVVRLPKNISDKDLWKIEAGLQLSKEKVADYGPINNLLMIREGKKAGLSPDEIAASMYGWSEKQVVSDLERLHLIDLFLEFFGAPGNYGIIKKFRLHEHFIDIQKGLVGQMKVNGSNKKDISKNLALAFIFLRTHIANSTIFQITHMDMRKICKMLLDSKTADILVEGFSQFEDSKKIPAERVSENFDNAVDHAKNLADKSKPGKLIDRAIAALSGIDRKDKHFKNDESVKTKMAALTILIKSINTDLGLK